MEARAEDVKAAIALGGCPRLPNEAQKHIAGAIGILSSSAPAHIISRNMNGQRLCRASLSEKMGYLTIVIDLTIP